jgi:hypothetical protein
LTIDEYINPAFWAEALREYAEKQAMPLPVQHADVGYRVPLARILSRVPSKAERIRLVREFYYAFNEEAMK